MKEKEKNKTQEKMNSNGMPIITPPKKPEKKVKK